MRVLVSFAVLAAVLGSCLGSRILVMSPMPSQSHANLFEGLVLELAKKGHEVTYMSPFPLKTSLPNLKEVIIPNLYTYLIEKITGTKEQPNGFEMRHLPPVLGLLYIMPNMGTAMSETLLEQPQVQELIHSKQKFDLIVGEVFLDESLLAGFAKKFDAPIVAVAPFMANLWSNFLIGNPAPFSYIPDPILGYSTKMTFFERVTNTVIGVIAEIMHTQHYLPKQDAIMRKHFGHDLPPITDIVKNTSLVLVNHHYSLGFPRPYLPNMVEIGGYHVPPAKELPADLKKYFDESKNGVILFSMGSHLKSAQMGKEKQRLFLNAFAKLKQDVLWKFEDDSLDNVPKNVKIAKWLPQSDILAHPNLKVFITHGGLLSTTEAIHRGVPMVGIPIAGDQPINMQQTENSGAGIKLEYDDLTEDVLIEAVNKVMADPRYRQSAQMRSALLRDTPLPPMDTALFWVEYVLRHKGAPHLRSAAQDLSWVQLNLLDVFAALALAASVVLAVEFYIARCIYRRLFRKKTDKTSAQKKKKN